MSKFPWFLLIMGVGGLFVTVPLALGGYQIMMEFFVTLGTRLIEGTPTWKIWQKIPIPIYMKIHFFNITNPSEIQTGAKAILKEIGPYVYLETMEKMEITVNDEDDTVRYKNIRVYKFMPKMSKGRETDQVTFLNMAYLGVASIAHAFTDADYVLNTLDSMIQEKGEKLTRTHRVRDILFEGFTVQNFLDLVNDPLVQSAGEVKVPELLLDGKVAIFEGKNSSDDGWYVVDSGKRNSADFGRVVTWQGSKSLKSWKDESCNAINGTDGILYQPFIQSDTVLQIFVSVICRSLNLMSNETVEVAGIPAYRFKIDPATFLGTEKNGDNWCFCPHQNLTHCNTDGVISIAGCFEGAPLSLSNPHFYNGDEKLIEGVVGLTPKQEDHEGYIDIHPLTGAGLSVHMRLQINFELTAWPAMPTFSEVSEATVPFLWLEEGGDLDGALLTGMKVLNFSFKAWRILRWVFIFFLILISAVGVAILFFQRKSSRVELLGRKEDEDDDEDEKK